MKPEESRAGPITFRMQVTHSNHKLELKHPPVSPVFFFEPVHPSSPDTLHIRLCLYARDCFFPLDDICYRRNKP